MANVRQNSVQALLADPAKQVTRAADALCALFRDVLVVRRINLLVWENKLYPNYMNRKEKRDERKDRGNLNNQLTSDTFTWSTFKKGIEFLEPRGATFTVTLYFDDEGHGHAYRVFLDPDEDETDDAIDDAGISPDTEINFADEILDTSTLARLFKAMVRDLKIDPKTWDKLLDDYMDHPYQAGSPKELVKKRRRSFDSDLRRKRFSWRTFRLAIVFLQAKYVSFELKMQWGEENATIHSLVKLTV